MPFRPLLTAALLAALPLAISSCSTSQAASNQATANAASITLSAEQKAKVGRKIWQNESGGKVDGLTHWNHGEDFASLGIGHALWFPAGADEKFIETFPMLMAYMRDRGVKYPAWMGPEMDCPWPNRAAFMRDFRSPKMNELRQFLKRTIPHQTDFIILRQQAAKTKILRAAPASERDTINARWNALTATPEGMFALIDYSNFKGEGTNPAERYQGQGWGILQVLQEMRGTPTGRAAASEFADAAVRVLARRVQLAPPARKESRWTAGWNNRVQRYKQPL
ncbi:hypothetical protein [Sulfuriroseicoccus oceanibius]|uniref:Lipoprotein n=1 Tax=Sulfuriroseicoccus oceanibius TaxID=2707525 RepID=A0A6B3L575_9BACT|nr:hypothetical protein [Sulfuriroseicoccus oceanibius]QQL44823.1 hypothetical protein G3M56_013225 [Sulfuriroseicoccus oceanibius]